MWQPRQKQKQILERGWYWKESVPYNVSARWIFYKLYDYDHLFGADKKQAYHNLFLPLFSKARKQFYSNWKPDSLVDDSREEFLNGFGYLNEKEWLEEGIGNQECIIDKWQYSKNYIEIWFEAFAMKEQFRYFAPNITLAPFKGDASIEYKWRVAKRLEQMSERYLNKPIKIIYFGDLDKKGLEIPNNALRDIKNWCSVTFDYVRGGLNPGDEARFDLGTSIDKTNSYQWESLSHEQAGELITSIINGFISQGIFSKIEAQEREATIKFKKIIPKILEILKE